MPHHEERVFAYFGEDLDVLSKGYLAKCASQGWTLLPLDASALAETVRASLAHTLVDDWLEPQARADARRLAYRWERSWFSSAREDFSTGGVCWPDLDRHAMWWFWQEVAFAEKLGKAFAAKGVVRLRFSERRKRRPGLYYYSADVFSAYWNSLLTELGIDCEVTTQATSIAFSLSFARRVWRQMRRLARRFLGTARNFSPAQPRDLEGKIVIALNAGESHRFAAIIQELVREFPGQVAGAILNASVEEAQRVAAEHGIPVAIGPTYVASDARIQGHFMEALEKARETAGSQPFAKPLRILDFHFEYFCRQRWPGLAAALQHWVDLWRHARPRAIVVSSLYDAESQLPAEAARSLGLPTFSIPHGAVGVWDDLIRAESLLYSIEPQRQGWYMAGISQERLIGCRGTVTKAEYPVVPGQHIAETEACCSILVLSNPVTSCTRRLLPGASIAEQIEGIRALVNPPADLAGQIKVCFKTHPGYPEVEIFEASSSDARTHLLPPNADLHTALQGADLVVALNYDGSALVHAVLAGKPIVFCWLDAHIGYNGHFNSSEHWLEAGEVVRGAPELWDTIRCLLDDAVYAGRLCSKARGYADKYLDDTRYPSMADIMRDCFDNPQQFTRTGPGGET